MFALTIRTRAHFCTVSCVMCFVYPVLYLCDLIGIFKKKILVRGQGIIELTLQLVHQSWYLAPGSDSCRVCNKYTMHHYYCH